MQSEFFTSLERDLKKMNRIKNSRTWAGVVVTYNRKDELIKNIESVLSQKKKFDRIYIIDNCSTDGTKALLENKGYLRDRLFSYIRLEQNLGGAGGFYTGLKAAFEDGYDLICLMDDDGRPENQDTFSVLYNAAIKACDINPKIMINPLVVCDTDNLKLSFMLGKYIYGSEVINDAEKGVLRDLINPFNGTVVSRELVKDVGYPNKDFFIRGDEMDYQVRSEKEGAYIATIVDSIYFHPGMELKTIKWNGKYIRVETINPWKSYYTVRNEVYRRKRDEGLSGALKSLLFRLYSNFKDNPNAKECLPFILKGFIEGMSGKLGMRVRPGQQKANGKG